MKFAILIITSITVFIGLCNAAVELRGKHRRALRSIAGRFKQEDGNRLVSINYTVEGSANSMQNILSTLQARELVQLRLDVAKKKEAKILATSICSELKCELIQVLGHTALLYLEGTPAGAVTKLLTEELVKMVGDNDE